MSVGIICAGDTQSIIFGGLLANTAINYAVETKQHFRYYATPEFTTVIQDIIASLKLRRWPSAILIGSFVEYKFLFGYSKKFSGILNTLYDKLGELSEAIKRLETPMMEPYNVIEVRLYDLPGEEVDILFRVASLAKERGISFVEILSENLKKVLKALSDCDVLVFLIDSSMITLDNTDPRYKKMLDYDRFMAISISLIAKYRSKKYGIKAGKIFPVFVFTKFDTIDKKVLNAIGISESIDKWLIEKDRKEINERLTKLLARFYQRTFLLTYSGSFLTYRKAFLIKVPLEKPEFFVSYLMTELEGGNPVPKVVKAPDGISYDLVYSRSEYIRFIDYLGKIANELACQGEQLKL
jgi:NTP pyrophosphatase (non-canonical NTP hydrolase)